MASMSVHASIPERALSFTRRTAGAPKLAAAYAVAGIGAIAVAPLLGSYALLAGWCGVASLVLAYAYAVNRPAVFGKRADGALSPWSVVVLFPYLIFVWTAFQLKALGLRRDRCWHRVSQGLYLGRKPCAGELPDDCNLIVDLTAEFPAQTPVLPWRRYVCLPTLNRHVPADADFLALLDALHAWRDGSIYVHCGAGRGRSAMVAAALLVMRGEALDATDAEAKLGRLRPGVRLHPAQQAIIARCCPAARPDATPQILSPYAESTSVWSAPRVRPTRSKR